jgi:hypothetical protein
VAAGRWWCIGYGTPDAPGLIENPLSHTNNNANFTMPAAPAGTCIYRFDPGSQTYYDGATYFPGVGWYPLSGNTNDSVLVLDVGQGFWVESPHAWTNTFVGELTFGSSTNPIPVHYSLKGSMVPQAGLLTTDLTFPGRAGDQVWKSVDLTVTGYAFDSGSWIPTEPSLAVSEACVVWRAPAQATPANWWIRNFDPLAAPANATATEGRQEVGPQIQGIELANQKIILRISNPAGAAYSVQHSGDGLSWTTVATQQTGAVWKTPVPGDARGYYQVVQP